MTTVNNVPEWKTFERAPNIKQAILGLNTIPEHWSLVPLQNKAPKDYGWQNAGFIPHKKIADLLLNGEKKISQKGNVYRSFPSGFGVRTGEASGGLMAIDIDGYIPGQILQELKKQNGGDLPDTVSCTSGKPYRLQMFYQRPEKYKEELSKITRVSITEYGDIIGDGSQLDFRLNGVQSAMPGSRHPDMGVYIWKNSPVDTPVAIAPDWLCELVIKLAKREQVDTEAKLKAKEAREEEKRLRRLTGFVGDGSLELILEESIQRLTADDIYNWNGHYFKQTRGKLQGCCPQHKSESGLSFHVTIADNSWWCFACQTGGGATQYRHFVNGGKGTPKGKEFIAIAKQLITEAGLEFPEYTPKTKRAREISKAEWDVLHKLPAEERELKHWVKSNYNRVAFKYFNKHGYLPPAPKLHPLIDPDKIREREEKLKRESAIVPYEKKNDGKLEYKFRGTIPTKEEWIEMGRPTIVYRAGQRLGVLKEAIDADWQFIQDKSTTGGGKSHDSGNATQKSLGLAEDDRIWYVAENYRNPTTETVERNFTPLPTRHDGLVSDDSQRTPLGNPFVRRPVNGEKTNIPGNCPETATFRMVESTGNTAFGGKDSPICTRCPLFNNCEFLNARREAYKETRIRAHLDQLGRPKEGDVAFIDEPGKTLGYSKEKAIGLKDLIETCNHLEFHTDLYAIVRPIAIAISNKISETYSDNSPRFGFSHDDVVKSLPGIEEIEKIHWDNVGNEFLTVADNWAIPSVFELKTQINSLLSSNLDQILEGGATPEIKQKLIKENLFLNWISPLLSEICGDKKYDFRIINQQLLISSVSHRHRSTIRGFRAAIFLDATMAKSELAQVLRVRSDEILPIIQELPDYSNLIVNILRNIGNCGKQRDNDSIYSQQQRINAAVEAIKAKSTGHIGLIDLKAYVNDYEGIETKGWWFNHNRGSNLFKNVSTLIGVGTPMANLGKLASDYFALTGDRPSSPNDMSGRFGDFVQRRTTAEIVQLVGRVRAHLRPTETINVWLLGSISGNTIEEIKEKFPGCQINEIEAYSLTPKAAPRGQQITRGFVEGVAIAVRERGNITINQAAAVVGISQGRASQIASSLGGFKNLKKILVSLFNALNRETNILEDTETLDPEVLWFAQTYLPLILEETKTDELEAIKELNGIYRDFGEALFEKILAATPIWAIAQLSGYAFELMGAVNHEDLEPIPIAA